MPAYSYSYRRMRTESLPYGCQTNSRTPLHAHLWTRPVLPLKIPGPHQSLLYRARKEGASSTPMHPPLPTPPPLILHMPLPMLPVLPLHLLTPLLPLLPMRLLPPHPMPPALPLPILLAPALALHPLKHTLMHTVNYLEQQMVCAQHSLYSVRTLPQILTLGECLLSRIGGQNNP